MKVEMKKAADALQTTGSGIGAAVMGAYPVAGADAFSTLLNTFTANDAKQAAMQPADFHSAKKSAGSPAAMNVKPGAAQEAAQKYQKAAAPAAKAESAKAHANDNAANDEAGEPNENDADADNAAKPETKNGAAQTAKTAQAAPKADQAQQPLKMEDVIKALNLSDQQVQQLAQALNISAADLRQMQITVTADAQTGAMQLTALMPGGKEQNLSAMLGMNQPSGKAATARAVMDKIAGILDLDSTQKQEFFAQLNVSSISFNSSGGAHTATFDPSIKNSSAAKQADQLQPSPAASAETGNAAAQNNAQSENSGNGGNPFNGEAAAQAAAAQNGETAAKQTPKTDFSAALGKAGQAASPAAAAQTTAAETATPEAKVMHQIVEKASLLQLPNATQAKISLNPKELGNVDIKLTMHDSSVTASIVVENSAVKQAVEQNLDQLKNALHQRGISVDEMMVSIDQGKGGNAQNSGQSQREAAAEVPFGGDRRHAPEPAPATPAFIRRPAGNHRVSITA